MRHLKSICHDISIHPMTLVYIGLTMICGLFQEYIMALSIVLIHELCHLLMAYYFTFDIEKVQILPFGAYLYISDYKNHSIIEEMCVVLAGPCSHLFMHIGIILFINGEMQIQMLSINYAIFVFNLAPIYPLDGNRLIGLMLQRVMDLQKAFYLQLKISIFVLCIICIFYIRISTIVILLYLFYWQLLFYKNIPYYLWEYYQSDVNKMKKPVLHYDLSYIRDRQNYYVVKGKVYNQKQMYRKLLKAIE